VIVNELVVVIAVCGSSLVLTRFRARRFSGAATTPHDLERMLAAVQRACADFLWQETRLLGLLAGVVLLAVAGATAAFAAPGSWPAAVAWSLAALALGVGGGALMAFFAHASAARTAHGALETLRVDRNEATHVTLRGANVLAVAVDAASMALSVLCFAAHYAFATTLGHVSASDAVSLASRTLVALAFGALCAAVVFQVGGASLHTAAGVAGAGARARDPRIADDEEQNPLLVAELVGDHMGGVVLRSTEAFAGSLLANAGLVLLAALVGRANAESEAGVLGLVALPLVIRSIGQFAASVALGSSRFEGHRSLPVTFAAARACQAALQIAGVIGATLWLLGATLFSTYALAGTLGVLASALSAGASALGSRRERPAWVGAPTPRNPAWVGAPTPRDSAPTLARALGLGLQRTWLMFTLVGGCLGAAWMVASRAPLAHGGALGLALAVAALLGATAFSSCESIFAALSENVHKLAGLRRSRFDEPARQKAAEMGRAGVAIGNLGRTQLILSAAAAALLAAVVLPLLSAGGRDGLSWAHPIVLMGGVLGAGSLSFHVGGMLKASSRAAASLDKNASDRLSREGEPARGDALHPDPYPGDLRHLDETPHPSEGRGPLPSYRESVLLATTSATQALLPFALGAVLAPFAVAVSIRLFYSAGGALIAYGLMAFSALGALTGCSAALVAQGTSLELARARRAGSEDASNTHSLVEFLERCIGPAALLGLKATVVSSLATVPLSL
jgi:Na+/H+-translocating membrane pyrophosphatase